MVLSIREANRRAEEQRRIQRLEAARKHGSSLGVLTARNYQVAKADQRKAVAEDLHQEWRKEIGRNQTQRNVLVSYAQHEAGGAHKKAEQIMVDRTARAATEKEAWEAERRLGAMRAALGHRVDSVEKEMKETWEKEIHAHRARTRTQEMQRSQEQVRRKREQEEAERKMALVGLDSNNPLVPRTQAEIQADATRPKVQFHKAEGGRAAVTFAVPPEKLNDPTYVAPAQAAEKVRQETKEKKRVQTKQSRDALERAQHNAALRASIEREEKEREWREKQNIKNVMAAASTEKNIAATASQRDFQSEEMRRSELQNRKAHQEFEYTFLQLQNGTVSAAQAAALERRRQQRDAFVYIDPNQDGVVVDSEGHPVAQKQQEDYLASRNRRRVMIGDLQDEENGKRGAAGDEWWNGGGGSATANSNSNKISSNYNSSYKSEEGHHTGPNARLRSLATDQIQTNSFPDPAAKQ